MNALKKTIWSILLAAVFFSFAGCGRAATANAAVDYGASSIYTQADMDEAINVIKKAFRSMKGCELHSLSYTSDDCTGADNVAWMNKLGEADGAKEIFTQCIVFESSFFSPEKGGGAWEAGQEYTWSWYLARSEGGKWKLMTWGY